jgi:spore coat protein U-like protein
MRFALALLGVFAAGTAQAQASFSIGVSATVGGGCAIAATPVNFGFYAGNASAPTVDTLGQVTVRCPLGTPYNVRMNNGTNAGPGGQRRMRQTPGTALLNYQLYRNAARTQRWGTTAPQRVNGTGSGIDQVLTVYGRLPGAQSVPFGAYLDTITVSIHY